MLGLGAGVTRILWKKSGGNLPFDPYSTGHINIANITPTGVLRSVTYTNTNCAENIEIADITATGALTHIDDL
jgi:hypothetical protein